MIGGKIKNEIDLEVRNFIFMGSSSRPLHLSSPGVKESQRLEWWGGVVVFEMHII